MPSTSASGTHVVSVEYGMCHAPHRVSPTPPAPPAPRGSLCLVRRLVRHRAPRQSFSRGPAPSPVSMLLSFPDDILSCLVTDVRTAAAVASTCSALPRNAFVSRAHHRGLMDEIRRRRARPWTVVLEDGHTHVLEGPVEHESIVDGLRVTDTWPAEWDWGVIGP